MPAHLCSISIFFLFCFHVGAPHRNPSRNQSVCYVHSGQLKRNSAILLVELNREQRRGEEMPHYKGEGRSPPVWLTSPGRTRSYAAQSMLDAGWQGMKQIIARLPEFLGKGPLRIRENMTEQNRIFSFLVKQCPADWVSPLWFCAMWKWKCLTIIADHHNASQHSVQQLNAHTCRSMKRSESNIVWSVSVVNGNVQRCALVALREVLGGHALWEWELEI